MIRTGSITSSGRTGISPRPNSVRSRSSRRALAAGQKIPPSCQAAWRGGVLGVNEVSLADQRRMRSAAIRRSRR